MVVMITDEDGGGGDDYGERLKVLLRILSYGFFFFFTITNANDPNS